jgi:probable F420-dependent oxidoreductase
VAETTGAIVATEALSGEALVALAQRLERLGYESLWLPELFGREPVATAGYVLGRTERLCVGTGIANVYVRDPHAMAQTRRTLAELSGGRFLLGLGVSNPGLNAARGHHWEPPLPRMRAYIDALAAAQVDSPEPKSPAPLYIAAHGPLLQTLGAERTDGVISYLLPPQHTRATRAHIGPDATLSTVVPVLAEPDPETARRKARKALSYYVELDYYHREWHKLGFAAADFSAGGSDRLIDSLVGWGDAAALARRVADYRDAGADRVILMPFDLGRSHGRDALELLAPAA